MLPLDRRSILDELDGGVMVITRLKNKFLYILEFDNWYHLFFHISGACCACQNHVPKDGRNSSVIRTLADRSDHVYKAVFDRDVDIYSLMSCAEEGIMSIFPDGSMDSAGCL